MISEKGPWFKDRGFLIELFAISNLGFLALDIFIAHSVNRFAHWEEWIPFVFSCCSPVVLIWVVFMDKRSGKTKAFYYGGMIVGGLSVAIGIAGLIYHLKSQFFEELTIKSLVYTAPFAAPLSYSGIGFLLLLNRMVAPSTDEWRRWIIFMAFGGFAGNFVLSLCDHAQNGFFSASEWIPVFSSAVAVGFLFTLIVSPTDQPLLNWSGLVLLIQILVGGLGFVLHFQSIIASTEPHFFDKIVYSAPVFVPLLLPNIALLGLIGIWDWKECSG